jgi:hypothetical protein
MLGFVPKAVSSKLIILHIVCSVPKVVEGTQEVRLEVGGGFNTSFKISYMSFPGCCLTSATVADIDESIPIAALTCKSLIVALDFSSEFHSQSGSPEPHPALISL